MKTIIFLLLFLGLYSVHTSAATGTDTLIMLNGTKVVGTIRDESMEALRNLQADINTWYTLVDQGDARPLKVQNKEIDYFIIGGVKYGNRHMPMGNKMVRIIVEGPASLYGMEGFVTNHFTHTDNTSNPNFETTTTSAQRVQLDGYVEMVIRGKKIPYSMNIPYITKHFARIFEQCPALIEESKKPGFDFNNMVAITARYNTLMAASGK